MICIACPLHQTRKRLVSVNGLHSAHYVLITDYPTKIDETIGKIFSGEEFKLLEVMIDDVSKMLDIVPWSFLIVPMLRCRPTDKIKGSNREPEITEILACTKNLMNQLFGRNIKQIFFDGKLVEHFYKKEFPDAITLQPIKFITQQGGQYSPWYRTNIRLLMEGIKK